MKEDGGPAFPRLRCVDEIPAEISFPTEQRLQLPGMTLRDWFAGMFFTSGHRPGNTEIPQNAEDIAKICYLVADSMLKQRLK